MSMRLAAFSLLMLLFLCLCIAQATGAGGGVLFIGVLHDVTASEIVLMVSTEQVPFLVTHDTSVTIDGNAASLGDLKSGDRVSVLTQDGESRTRIAVDVSAWRSRHEP
jgi:hypothetical protein